jgi:hypothetical protein
MPRSGAGGEQVTSTPHVRAAWAILFMTVGLVALGLLLRGCPGSRRSGGGGPA